MNKEQLLIKGAESEVKERLESFMENSTTEFLSLMKSHAIKLDKVRADLENEIQFLSLSSHIDVGTILDRLLIHQHPIWREAVRVELEKLWK